MTPDLMLELAWKSGLIAAAALAGAALLRARPAAERVAVLRLGVVMLLALPLLVALMPALRVQAPAVVRPAAWTVAMPPARPDAPVAVMTVPATRIEAAPTPTRVKDPEWRIEPVTAALVVWAAGCAALALRLLAGVTLLYRWTRRAEPVSDPRWLAALARAARGRTPPVLRASPRVTSPLSWGWRPAVILLDPAVLEHAERADAVLAHEMGHVRHGDWLCLMASRLLLALYWFNPLVWILQRELARQSEQAADAWAAGRIGRADYASALVAMAGRGRPHAALGMAAPRGELARRVIAIMHGSASGGKPWRAALALAACVAFATPLAAVELNRTVLIPVPPSTPRSGTVPGRAESPALAAADITAALTQTVARPADVPVPPAELATVERQRDQGLAMMEAGARVMEAQARQMRLTAAGLEAGDRAQLIADADGLLRDAAELRAEARDLAARDLSTLKPMSPEEERDLAESLRHVLAVPDPLALPAPAPQTVAADVAVQRDSSGAYRTSNGVEVDASGALRTSSGVSVNASGEVIAANGARIDAAGEIRAAREQRRIGALQLRNGARQLEAAALAADSATAADLTARAADLHRQADAMEPDG